MVKFVELKSLQEGATKVFTQRRRKNRERYSVINKITQEFDRGAINAEIFLQQIGSIYQPFDKENHSVESSDTEDEAEKPRKKKNQFSGLCALCEENHAGALQSREYMRSMLLEYRKYSHGSRERDFVPNLPQRH